MPRLVRPDAAPGPRHRRRGLRVIGLPARDGRWSTAAAPPARRSRTFVRGRRRSLGRRPAATRLPPCNSAQRGPGRRGRRTPTVLAATRLAGHPLALRRRSDPVASGSRLAADSVVSSCSSDAPRPRARLEAPAAACSVARSAASRSRWAAAAAPAPPGPRGSLRRPPAPPRRRSVASSAAAPLRGQDPVGLGHGRRLARSRVASGSPGVRAAAPCRASSSRSARSSAASSSARRRPVVPLDRSVLELPASRSASGARPLRPRGLLVTRRLLGQRSGAVGRHPGPRQVLPGVGQPALGLGARHSTGLVRHPALAEPRRPALDQVLGAARSVAARLRAGGAPASSGTEADQADHEREQQGADSDGPTLASPRAAVAHRAVVRRCGTVVLRRRVARPDRQRAAVICRRRTGARGGAGRRSGLQIGTGRQRRRPPPAPGTAPRRPATSGAGPEVDDVECDAASSDQRPPLASQRYSTRPARPPRRRRAAAGPRRSAAAHGQHDASTSAADPAERVARTAGRPPAAGVELVRDRGVPPS